MFFKAQATIYGSKTTSEIAALTGMRQGDTVFNTDYGQVEYYTSAVWTNDNSVLMIASGSTISEGQLVRIATNGSASLLVTGGNNSRFGIGVCQYGGSSGSTISVRTSGIAKCRTTANTTRGEYGVFSSTPGAMTRTTAPSTGAIGRILQSVTSGSVAYVFLSFMERA